MLSLPDFEQKKLIITFPLAGQRISLKNENLIISEEDNVVLQISCHKIFSLWIIGNTTITSGLLEKVKSLHSLFFCTPTPLEFTDLGIVASRETSYLDINSIVIKKMTLLNIL